MSAHLTVSTMAIEAERPLRIRAAQQAHLAAQADAASGHRAEGLLHHIGSTLRRSPGSGVAAQQWTGTGRSGFTIVGQPAG